MQYKKADIRPGLLVVLGKHPEAQVYTVRGGLDGNSLRVVWFAGSHKCEQWIDYSLAYKPTLEQIEYSINVHGRLANIMDVVEVTCEVA
jgi:hypothetical protein